MPDDAAWWLDIEALIGPFATEAGVTITADPAVAVPEAIAAAAVIRARLAAHRQQHPSLHAMLAHRGLHIDLEPGNALPEGCPHCAHGDETADDGVALIRLPAGLAPDAAPPSPGGHRVEAQPSLPGVLDHEIGHAIEAPFAAAMALAEPGWTLAGAYAAQDKAAAQRGLSVYVAHDEHEWFAEAVAAWAHPARAGAGYDLGTLARPLDRVFGGGTARLDAQASAPDVGSEVAEPAAAEVPPDPPPDTDPTPIVGAPAEPGSEDKPKRRADVRIDAAPDVPAGENAAIGQRAAGLLLTCNGEDGDKVLFVRHAERGTWEFPGGMLEDGESAEAAVAREVSEELGAKPDGKISLLMRNTLTGVDYSTFIANVSAPFEPDLASADGELSEWVWAAPDAPPEPLHPGARIALERLRMNELDVARAIRSGEFSSPQQYENMWLFAIRVTGTGVSYRPDRAEYVWRPPEVYLNAEFLERIQGLPVIWVHPPSEQLTTREYRRRSVGSIMLPYIEGDEVWCIARIYDDEAAEVMRTEEVSTSPGVVFRDPSVNETRQLEDGQHLFIEGDPSLIDHCAIVSLGVWDKGGQATGVAVGEAEMAEAEVSMAEAEPALAMAAPQLRIDGTEPDELSEIVGLLAMIAACLDHLEAPPAVS